VTIILGGDSLIHKNKKKNKINSPFRERLPQRRALRKGATPPIRRNPPPKKGKSGSSFGPLPRKGGSFVRGGSLGGARRINARGSIGGQTRQGTSVMGDPRSIGDLSTRYA
jgi:hypothetical protein